MSKEDRPANLKATKVIFIAGSERPLQTTFNYLKKRGWETIFVSSIKECLDIIPKEKPTHVMLSYNLPNCNVVKTEKMLTLTFRIPCVVFTEKALDGKAQSSITSSSIRHHMVLPISGPSAHLKIKNLIQEAQNKDNSKSDQFVVKEAKKKTVVCAAQDVPKGGQWDKVGESENGEPVWMLTTKRRQSFKEQPGHYIFSGTRPPELDETGGWSSTGGEFKFEVGKQTYSSSAGDEDEEDSGQQFSHKRKTTDENDSVLASSSRDDEHDEEAFEANQIAVVTDDEISPEFVRDDKGKSLADFINLDRRKPSAPKLTQADLNKELAMVAQFKRNEKKIKQRNAELEKNEAAIERARMQFSFEPGEDDRSVNGAPLEEELAQKLNSEEIKSDEEAIDQFTSASEDNEHDLVKLDQSSSDNKNKKSLFSNSLKKITKTKELWSQKKKELAAQRAAAKERKEEELEERKRKRNQAREENAPSNGRANFEKSEENLSERRSEFKLDKENDAKIGGESEESVDQDFGNDSTDEGMNVESEESRQKQKARQGSLKNKKSATSAFSKEKTEEKDSPSLDHPLDPESRAEDKELPSSTKKEKKKTPDKLPQKESDDASQLASSILQKATDLNHSVLAVETAPELSLNQGAVAKVALSGKNNGSILAKSVVKALEATVENNHKLNLEGLSVVAKLDAIPINSENYKGLLIVAEGGAHRPGMELPRAMKSQLLEIMKGLGEPLKDEGELELNVSALEFIRVGAEFADFLTLTQHRGRELGVAFFSNDKIFAAAKPPNEHGMIQIDTSLIQPNQIINFDAHIYMPINAKYLRYVKKGGYLLDKQKEKMANNKLAHFFVKDHEAHALRGHCASQFVEDIVKSFEKIVKKAS